MPDRVGQQFGNYRLTRMLGKGGFAEVYLGEHLFLKNFAAVKVLFATPTGREAQEFLFEAQTLARLIHPHIVPIREFAILRGTPFLAMDYAAGGTLRQRYARGTCLSLETTVAYIKQIAAALQYAHNHNIIHRDVKPENFLLDARQNLLLSDFGISLISYSASQGTAGTLPYMAPEQNERKASFASDQYALGIVAYEWLCGTPPFVHNFAYQHAHVPPPPLREKDPSLPEAVEAAVLKALAKDPQDRYASVLQFARALERASQGTAYRPAPGYESTYLPSPDIPRKVVLLTPSLEDLFVAQVKVDLEVRDVAVESSASNGQSPGEAMRQVVREAQLMLLIPSSDMRSSSAFGEYLRMATIYRRKIVCIRTADDAVKPPLPEDAILIDARGAVRYRQAFDELMTLLEHERKGIPPAELVPLARTFEPRNPYKGLSAFTTDDARDFFGRESLVQEMVKSLAFLLQPAPLGVPGKRLLTVIGPGGSGKSSVVMAGLLPRLQRGALASSETWTYLDPVAPGQHPLDALANALAPRFPDRDMQMLRANLGITGSYGLHQLATTLVQRPGARVVLVIDQFEELFSPNVSEQERQQFIDLLLTAVTEPRGPVLALLTLRADFYDRPLAYPALGRLIQQHQCAVGPLEPDELRAVIEQPAAQPDVWLAFEADLVSDLLFDMRGQAGALPLLEFTLDQLFQHRQEHLLTSHAYKEIGGVKGALTRHAENTYVALPSDEHRKLARALFLRLITPGTEGHEPIRRRTPLAEFSLDDPIQTHAMQETIDAFLAARLLLSNQIAGITTLEISHEALIRAWSRLRDWIHEAQAQDSMRLQQSLSSDAAEWEQRGRLKDRLYPRSQLKELRAWRAHNLISKQEIAFLQASARQQTRKRLRTMGIILLVFLLLIPTTAFTLPIIFSTTVTNLNNSGSGSLRQIIDNAKPGSTITFAPWVRGTILLNDVLDLKKNVTITGPGASILSISFGDKTRSIFNNSFQVDPGAIVHIYGIAFENSKGPDAVIVNDGNLTLDHCNISHNEMTENPQAHVASMPIFNDGTLTLINSTISENRAQGANALSGGIDNNGGTISLFNSTISHNKAIGTNGKSFAGGINSSGEITLTNSSVLNNVSMGTQSSDGGGISISNVPSAKKLASLILNNSIISGNSVTITSNQDAISNGKTTAILAGGGGITVLFGTLTVNNSTISGNTSTGGQGVGGGIYNGSGHLTISNSTVSSNTTTSRRHWESGGGGIYTLSGTLKMTNSTVSGNTATGGLGGFGGGIALNDSQGTIDFSTIYGNKATASGGGLSFYTTQITAKNTIIASNTAGTGPDVSGTLTSGGYNLIQRFAGATFLDPLHLHSTDISASPSSLGIDPHLRNNGGLTMTHTLLPGSPAIDRIPTSACDSDIDQRGVKRPQGSACDSGAYEYKPIASR